jgi:ATP-binding cassette, subfamily F, member 3
MIQARSLCLSLGSRIIFNNISFVIDQSDRIGLVGRNGSGKTTLLKAIIDPSLLDSGTISLQTRKKIAYMPQEVILQSSLSILDETLSTFSEVYKLQQDINHLEKILEESSTADTFEQYRTLEQYHALQEKLMSLQPDILKAQTKKVLMGLGFSTLQFDQLVSTLSVGWKMRIVLAKLLLQEADFYLFDEPTNHLDLMAKEWFLNFLKQSDFGFILISHERYFLNELCHKVLELELGKATWYTGNYDDYVIKKEHNFERLQATYTQQQKEIKHKQEMIDRLRAGQKAKMATSMEKALEKMERIEIPPSPKNVSFTFPPIQQSGKEVIKVSGIAHAFNNKMLFHQVSFEVKRGQKVALIAPNGVGKTTLLNLIAGKLPLQQGSITFGHNVTYALFTQDQNQVLDRQRTIMENIKHLCPQVTEQTIRAFLGAFLFSGDDAFKKIAVLSGGEKNRVGIVSVLLQHANLLLLDEPTNHLDIPSKDILLRALKEFPGTVVFVSHDRDFINALATDILELNQRGTHYYHGNYDAYLDQKEAL